MGGSWNFKTFSPFLSIVFRNLKKSHECIINTGRGINKGGQIFREVAIVKDFQTENAGYYTQRGLKLHDQGKIFCIDK